MNERDRRPEPFDETRVVEERAARRLSEQIDRMLAGEPADPESPELVVAARLSRLADALPPIAPAFEKRVLSPVRRGRGLVRWPFPARALSVAAVAAVLVLALTLTVPGQAALARLAAVFHLDSVQVGINVATATPADSARVAAPRIERALTGVTQAAEVAPVPVLVPEMPAGWSLRDVRAVYYPDLPANVPLNIILAYESQSGASLEIAEFFIRLGDNVAIDSLSRTDELSRSAREVQVDGRPAILVEGSPGQDHRALIWQQDDILLEIDAIGLGADDLLALASSMHSVD